MVLNDIFFVVFFTAYFTTLPVLTLAVIGTSPFTRKEDAEGEGWLKRYKRALKTPGDPRREPFPIPMWLYILLHLIIMVLMVVPVYSVFHNAGADDGWSSRPIALMFSMGAHALYAFWLTMHFATHGHGNVIFIQVLTALTALVATIELVKVTDLGWMSLPYLFLQIFYLIKLSIESYYTEDKSVKAKQ